MSRMHKQVRQASISTAEMQCLQPVLYEITDAIC